MSDWSFLWSWYLMNQAPCVCGVLSRILRQNLSRQQEGECQQLQSLELIQFVKIYADCTSRKETDTGNDVEMHVTLVGVKKNTTHLKSK